MNEWGYEPFGEIVDNFDYQRIPVAESKRIRGEYPYYGASGIIDYVNDFIFDGEYLLIAEDGENLKSRKTPIAFMANGKFWVNNHAHIVKANNKAITRYILYAFLNIDINGYISGSAQPKLSQDSLNRIEIPLPPLPEQMKIVRVLGNLDDKIELNRQMNKTLEAMAMTLYRHYFINFGLPPNTKYEADECPFGNLVDTDEMGPVPEGWEIGKISDILFLEYGKSLPEHKRIFGDYPVYGSNGIVGYHNEYISKGPGIIVGRKGTAGQVIRTENNFFPIDTTYYVKPKIDYYSMNTLYLILIHQKLKEMNFDSAVPGLNRNNAYDIDCIIPPQNVVKDFSKKIDHFFTLIDNINNEIPLLINTREYLLPKLISGEVKVQ